VCLCLFVCVGVEEGGMAAESGIFMRSFFHGLFVTKLAYERGLLSEKKNCFMGHSSQVSSLKDGIQPSLHKAPREICA